MQLVGKKVKIVTIQLSTVRFEYDVFVDGKDVKTPLNIFAKILWAMSRRTLDLTGMILWRSKYLQQLISNNVADPQDIVFELETLISQL